uniref:NADH-ubiquinone oxidoreductase chain 4L n=4 Tax=Papilio dardanus TaxID=77259 RepID=S4SVS5_PAPDA|nr:NADH dehydrogenase subunit 4L [Papilio dardanus]APC61764.1 NADH dehydrogenase subunit 4L [Papilio dardanus polytrophus]APC61802.1 NADH dehydrogenase subunit 4L [Papilio dardanus tibullus]APC61828.1 NADH dehydrogenase subunit 4L [Papilio dardanus dardanus]APC61790.1 NADH dehydrogenase subunit 4L [Papilio dardanus]
MMVLNMWFIILLMFILGNMIFISKHKHLLIVLLSLEFIILSIFFMMIMMMNYMEYNMYMLMIFLLFSVCEGALGLSILVSMIRTHGNDYFQSFSML